MDLLDIHLQTQVLRIQHSYKIARNCIMPANENLLYNENGANLLQSLNLIYGKRHIYIFSGKINSLMYFLYYLQRD